MSSSSTLGAAPISRPMVIGVCGATNSGKTTLTRTLYTHYRSLTQHFVLYIDDYFDVTTVRMNCGDWETADNIDLELLVQQLTACIYQRDAATQFKGQQSMVVNSCCDKSLSLPSRLEAQTLATLATLASDDLHEHDNGMETDTDTDSDTAVSDEADADADTEADTDALTLDVSLSLSPSGNSSSSSSSAPAGVQHTSSSASFGPQPSQSLSNGLPSNSILFVEGFVLFHFPEVRQLLDHMLYIDVTKDTCRLRRYGAQPTRSQLDYFDSCIWPAHLAANNMQELKKDPRLVIINGQQSKQEVAEQTMALIDGWLQEREAGSSL